FTPVGLSYPVARLVKDRWMQSVPLSADDLPALPQDSLFEGMTIFDGELYSFPLFSPRQYTTLTWFNKELIDKAGLDPTRDLASWDDLRGAARTIRQNVPDTHGLVLPIELTDRLGIFVGEL